MDLSGGGRGPAGEDVAKGGDDRLRYYGKRRDGRVPESRRSLSKRNTWAWIDTSCAKTTASAKINFGPDAGARTMLRGCRYPPVNSHRYLIGTEAKPF